MSATYFTLNGVALSSKEISKLDSFDLLKAFTETVDNARKNGASKPEWFAQQCLNSAAEAAGKPRPFEL